MGTGSSSSSGIKVIVIGLVAVICVRGADSEPDPLACGAGELLLAALVLERVLAVAVVVRIPVRHLG